MHSVGTGTLAVGYLTRNDDERIHLIRNLIFESIKDPLVLWVARSISSNCPSRDEWCELSAIYNAVKNGPIPIPIYDENKRRVTRVIKSPGLRFVEDTHLIDNYPSAGKILEWLAQGVNGEDCDGHVILIASLAMALGYQTGVVIASKDGRIYVHIFPVIGVPKLSPEEWIPMDTTVPQATVGWWPPPSYGIRKMKLYAIKPGKIQGRRIA